MIKIGDKEYRNLQEQVEKNKNDILFILQEEGVLNEFGIKVIGQEETTDDLPSVADYKEAHADWDYGDAYAIGTEAPFELYVLTRANGTHPSDYWFNIGEFPMPGPQGEQGEQGIQGETGATGSTGATGAQGPQGPRGYSTRVISEELVTTVGYSTQVTVENGMVHDIVISKHNNSNGVYGEVTSIDTYGNAVVKTLGSLRGPQGQQGIQGIQGPQGEQGPAGQDGTDGVTPSITALASVGANTGSPTVTVTKSGTDASPTFSFAFDGLKGETGATGQTGATGATGPVPVVSAVATVDAQVGTPTVTVTKSGTDASPTFTFAFSNIKGDTGTSLISVEVVSTLPASGTPGTLYFVPNGSASGTDLYNEYIWINNTWELLGTASVDLTNYIQKSQTAGLVKNDGTIDTNTYVTTDTDQTITGSKTIQNELVLDKSASATSYKLKFISNFLWGDNIRYLYTIGNGDLRFDSGGSYGIKFPTVIGLTADKTLATTDQIPDATNMVTTNTAQDITALKTFKSGAIIYKGQYTDAIELRPYGVNNSTRSVYISPAPSGTNETILGISFGNNNSINITGYTNSTIGLTIAPQRDNLYNLGDTSHKWKNFYFGGYLSDGNNANYGLKLPDTTSFTADKTIATTDQIPEEVIANPTLAGTEANLTGIQIGSTKYAIPSGGGNQYSDYHIWKIQTTGTNTTGIFYILSKDSSLTSGRTYRSIDNVFYFNDTNKWLVTLGSITRYNGTSIDINLQQSGGAPYDHKTPTISNQSEVTYDTYCSEVLTYIS